MHPEELLDRDLKGTLTSEQRTHLDAHLARCEVCRLERLMRADFAAQAARESESDMQAFVLGALQRAAVTPVASVHAAVPVAPASPARTGRMSALLVAACVLLATGAAFARTGWAERAWELASSWGEQAAPNAEQPREAARRSRPARPDRNLASEAPAPAAAASVIAAVAEPKAVEPPLSAPPHARAPRDATKGKLLRAHTLATRTLGNKHKAQRAKAPSAVFVGSTNAVDAAATTSSAAPLASTATAQAGEPVQVAQTQVTSAASLFEQANRARQQAHGELAAQLYRELQARFASSAEARLSHALLARMWLDHGNARGALASFEHYLDGNDQALREEAMAGRALALTKLGRTGEAEQAFSALLAAYPRSSYAALAKRKLGQD